MAGAYYKQKLSGEVRDLTLREIKSVLLDKKCVKNTKEFRQTLLLRLAGSVLPRVQEISGADGKDLFAKVIILPERKNE
jgi:hypothetical protein